MNSWLSQMIDGASNGQVLFPRQKTRRQILMKISLTGVVDAFRAQEQEKIEAAKEESIRQAKDLLERQTLNAEAAEGVRTQFMEIWSCYPEPSQLGSVETVLKMEAASFEIRFDYVVNDSTYRVTKLFLVVSQGGEVLVKLVSNDALVPHQRSLDEALGAGRKYTHDIPGMLLKHAAWVGKAIALKDEANR